MDDATRIRQHTVRLLVPAVQMIDEVREERTRLTDRASRLDIAITVARLQFKTEDIDSDAGTIPASVFFSLSFFLSNRLFSELVASRPA